MIWQFKLKQLEFGRRPIPVRSAAQAPNYYFEEDEKYLAEEIEAPAHAPLNKLRQSEDLSPEERIAVSVYVQSMLTRGPKARHDRKPMLPTVFEKLRAKTLTNLPDLVEEFKIPADEWIAALEELRKQVMDDRISDKSVFVKSQYSTGILAWAIYHMQWVVIHSVESEEFITGDSPAFFTKDLGFKHQKSELSFPLSPAVALHASWRGRLYGLDHLNIAAGQIVKEINRRTIHSAVRFVYSPTRPIWVKSVSSKPAPRLSPLHLHEGEFSPIDFPESHTSWV